jgi:hypothetical protein
MSTIINPTNGFSDEAKDLLASLSKEERRKIRKNYPNPIIRDRKIRELRAQGWKTVVLAEVVGCTQTNITRICKARRTNEKNAGISRS